MYVLTSFNFVLVNEGFQFRGHVGDVRGRGEDDAVALLHPGDAVVGDVVGLGAAAVLLLEAGVAGAAAVDVAAAELDDFRLDAFGLERLEELVDEDARVAVLARASVEGDDSHGESLRGNGSRRDTRTLRVPDYAS